MPIEANVIIWWHKTCLLLVKSRMQFNTLWGIVSGHLGTVRYLCRVTDIYFFECLIYGHKSSPCWTNRTLNTHTCQLSHRKEWLTSSWRTLEEAHRIHFLKEPWQQSSWFFWPLISRSYCFLSLTIFIQSSKTEESGVGAGDRGGTYVRPLPFREYEVKGKGMRPWRTLS